MRSSKEITSKVLLFTVSSFVEASEKKPEKAEWEKLLRKEYVAVVKDLPVGDQNFISSSGVKPYLA